MAASDITVQIVKEIREATRATNARLDSMEVAFSRRLDTTSELLDVVTGRLDVISDRLDLVETTVLNVAEQARLTVHYTKALCKQ